jgi:hypothetical protein
LAPRAQAKRGLARKPVSITKNHQHCAFRIPNRAGYKCQEHHQYRDAGSATEVTTRAAQRQLDNHELRITEIEKQMLDAAGWRKEAQESLNNPTSDTLVMKEILQRIEASRSAVTLVDGCTLVAGE